MIDETVEPCIWDAYRVQNPKTVRAINKPNYPVISFLEADLGSTGRRGFHRIVSDQPQAAH
ncbi:hypothetical protein ANO14919_120030 [Xylariales sp. No.14919]|nr:hypothetical protein ANO14919_120030 [Xylariales sp. No.14919]